jgi:hypothetical protein
MLNGSFHHAIIFPQLSAMGFNPKETENPGVANFLTKLKANTEPMDSFLDPLAAIVYSRAKLESTLSDVDQEFVATHLVSAKQLGTRLVQIVQDHALENQQSFSQGLQKANELLQLQPYLVLFTPNAT